jgi:hypothetical protein
MIPQTRRNTDHPRQTASPPSTRRAAKPKKPPDPALKLINTNSMTGDNNTRKPTNLQSLVHKTPNFHLNLSVSTKIHHIQEHYREF